MNSLEQPTTPTGVLLHPVVRVQASIHQNCGHDCLDLDDECVDVKDPLACWQYQPERGHCPLLRNRQN